MQINNNYTKNNKFVLKHNFGLYTVSFSAQKSRVVLKHSFIIIISYTIFIWVVIISISLIVKLFLNLILGCILIRLVYRRVSFVLKHNFFNTSVHKMYDMMDMSCLRLPQIVTLILT